jgi:hypothetical protein
MCSIITYLRATSTRAANKDILKEKPFLLIDRSPFSEYNKKEKYTRFSIEAL